MNIITQLISKLASGRRPGLALNPKYITIHGTGNRLSTAKNEADNVCHNEPLKESSFHFVVGEDVIYQVLPTTEVAWHAGDGYDGPGNRQSIAIEMVETGDRKKVIENTIALVVDLMSVYGIPLDHVVTHKHWSGKICPRILLTRAYIQNGMDWLYFTTQLGKEYEQHINQAWKWAQDNHLITSEDKDDTITYGQLVAILYKLMNGR